MKKFYIFILFLFTNGLLAQNQSNSQINQLKFLNEISEKLNAQSTGNEIIGNGLLMNYDLQKYYAENLKLEENVAEKVIYKSPWLAFFLSLFLPTSGQIYNGEYTKALIQAGLMLGGGGLVTTMACVECGDYGTAQTGLLIAGAAMLFSGYIWSIIDAPMSANNINVELNYNNRNQVINSRSEIFGKHHNLFFSGNNLISIKIKL